MLKEFSPIARSAPRIFILYIRDSGRLAISKVLLTSSDERVIRTFLGTDSDCLSNLNWIENSSWYVTFLGEISLVIISFGTSNTLTLINDVLAISSCDAVIGTCFNQDELSMSLKF